MTAQLKPYPSYKDSGLPWLGKIPAHWETKNLKHCTKINAKVLPETTSPNYRFYYIDISAVGTGVLRELPEVVRFSTAPSRARRIVQQGDTIISTVRTYLKAVYYIEGEDKDLVVSTGFAVLTPLDRVYPKFLSFVAQSFAFTESVTAHSVGIVYPAIPETKFARLKVVMPSLNEQAAIVRYLDYVDRRIRRYIRAKRRLIELLNEQKQAIIHQAVTRGLDPNVPLKPSGVEWLGDVPGSWKSSRLKYVAKVQTGLTLGKSYGTNVLEERPYLRVANVQDGYLDLEHITTIQLPRSELEGSQLQTGDVLMTEGGDIDKLGRGHIWQGEIDGCLHQNHIFAVRTNNAKLMPEFLSLLMTSGQGRIYFQATAKKTTNLASTNSTTLKSFPIFLPDIKEQRRILRLIANKTTAIDTALEIAKTEIDLMREYHIRLIADVVTGKLDVRHVELPEEEPTELTEDVWDEIDSYDEERAEGDQQEDLAI